MYVIVKIGGKQYRAAKGDIIEIDLLPEDQKEVIFDGVLFFHNGKEAIVGSPLVSDCFVKGEVVGTAAGPKIESIKYKPSHHQYRKFGHRQHYSRIKITSIGSNKGEGSHGA